MTSRMYREEELIDGLVVDSEGYVCGYVENFGVKPDSISLNLYEYEGEEVETLDEDKLIKKLLEHIPLNGSQSIISLPFQNKKNGLEELYSRVRKTLNLSRDAPVTLEHFVEYAVGEGVEIPYEVQEVKEKYDKGSIDWSYVDKIAFSDLGNCILLKEDVEAERRGISSSGSIGYKSTKDLAGRLVLDSNAKIIGSVAKFLVGAPPGILINIERLIKLEKPDTEALKAKLIPSSFQDLQHLYERVKKDQGLNYVTDDDLYIWAKKKDIDVPNNVLEKREVVMDFPLVWNKIAKIGDVVILNSDIDALIQEKT